MSSDLGASSVACDVLRARPSRLPVDRREPLKTLFIVGCSRSGTTMLQQALNRHSQIVIPPETKFFYYFYGRRRKRQRAQWERIQRDLQIELPQPASVRRPDEAHTVFHEMAKAYLERLEHQGVAYFGDKTPEHTSHLHAIREVFPDAKILFLYRDGRDVALSLTKVPWIRCNICGGMLIWLHYYRILKRERENPSPNTLFLRYEDLVYEPIEELSRVQEFLGLDYEPQVADGFGNREGIPEREYAWKSRALEKITASRVGLWRRRLSNSQVERLECIAGDALEDLGYARTTAAPSSLSVWLRLRLSCDVIRTASQLPIVAIANELTAFARRRSVSSQSAFTEVE